MEGLFTLLGTYFGDAFGYLGVLLRYFYIWGPFVFGIATIVMFFRLRRAAFLASKKPVLLEIKIPKDHDRTPLAMEVAFNGLFHTYGETTWIDKTVKGQTRPVSSLEIVSVEGDVRFYIWCWEETKGQVKSNMYSQYPTLEIQEVEDYTHLVRFDEKKYDVWGCEFKLTKPDPYPIKTYIDYGLDKVTDEEYKTDPITPIIETWSSLGKGQYMWYQIIVQAHKKKLVKGSLFKQEKWTDETQRIINDLMFRDPKTKKPLRNGDEQFNLGPQLTEEEKTIIAALQRNTDKPGFDCGMRALYINEKEHPDPAGIGILLGAVRHFNSANLNGFAPVRGMIPFDWPWQDFRNIRQNRAMRRLIDAYKRRSYHHPPYKRPPFILSTEELATMYHFPGKVAGTPTFGRIDATKAEPPANLPI